MNVFEREVGGRRYRIASQSVWDPRLQRPFARQAVLGPADPPPVADLGRTRTVGTRRVGDVGALTWVAEQLDVIKLIDQACGVAAPAVGPTVGEMVLAVAAQRACAPAAKCHLGTFLESCVPRVSCLPASAFTGQAFHRLARRVTAEQLESAQIAIARAIVRRFELSTDLLAFDTTNFDTHIATTTPGELARRGKAKSKRGDLRVVGLAVLVSETGHVPLLHRTYPGNGSDQSVLRDCLLALGQLHEALDEGEQRPRGATRTLVRDGGCWSEQLELDLDVEGYATLISLPLSHTASQWALEQAARRGAMKPLGGKLEDVRAARFRTQVGGLDRTLVVVESQELLRGQKRGIAVALRKAQEELRKLQRVAARGRIARERLEERVTQALRGEHLSDFVVTEVKRSEKGLSLDWHVDAVRRRQLERTRWGRRVLCTDRHIWSTGRIVYAFRGQWNVEEVFRRAKKGGLVPWGPSYQWADSSLRLHTFATVLGLTLVSLVRLAFGTRRSAGSLMKTLAAVKATLVRVRTQERGRRPTVMLAPDLSAEQRKAVRTFELERWIPGLLSSMTPDASRASATPAA
ncbi:MAG: IS1634 family transposase [Acidobacteria bacterium]|nr:IS1634 family transposase [Acidobacteriota bacterium]